MTLGWLAERLREAGLPVHETPGWQDRGRPGPFDPRGVLLHHSAVHATDSDPHPSLSRLVDGARSPVEPAGPLCHVLIDRNAECWVIAAGRAEHAGRSRASGPMPEGDGSELYVGIKLEYAATAQRPTQYATSMQKSRAAIVAARIVAALGASELHVRAHKETSHHGRTDPYDWDMTAFRYSVRQCLERTGW